MGTLLAACGAPKQQAAEPTPPADLVLMNGDIYTGDPVQPRVQALAIRSGHIVAIGSNDEIRHINTQRTIDLGGRLVIPGINDAHVHEPALEEHLGAALGARVGAKVTDAALDKSAGSASEPAGQATAQGAMVDLPGEFDTLTVPDMLASIERATHEQPAGTWLHAVLSRAALDDPTLTREGLDRVAPAHPVWIDNFAGHALVFNSAAERAAGIDASAPVPRGAFVGRDGKGGHDGWRYEYARYAALRAFGAKVSDADVNAAIRDFEARAGEFGITTVQALPLQVDDARLETALRASQRTLRWHVMRVPVGEIIAPPYMLALVDQGLAGSPELEGMVTVYGTKYWLDGTPIERGAALREPYADAPTDGRPPAGRADFDPAAIREMLVRARASGDPLHLHIAGDVQLQALLAAMEELRPKKPGSVGDWPEQRVVIEHGDGIAAADIARIRALGIVVVQNPSHMTTPELMRARLGDRVARWMPMKSLVTSGVPFALGSDGPLNPFLNIKLATEHPANPDEALTREQALVAYTQGAAYDERTEQFKGKLITGYAADLAVLSQDIFTVPADALPHTRSVMTIVGGTIVLDRLSPASAPTSERTE
ncbi:MAG TPA: amidohydrolase family protein [Kofleriaceae bacterium]|nr:amidohydrolase family protein [Kofleriaceae bacterium]